MSDNKSWFENGNPRIMFVFGFVSGVALLSLITSGTLVSMINPAASAVDSNTAASATNTGNTAKANTATTTTTTTTKKAVPEVSSTDHLRGSADAKVVLIEYADFECPYCVRHHPNMEKLMEEYDGQIAWVYRHFPLSFHADAQPAAVASECASEQGKFWEFADAMFAEDVNLGESFYLETATSLGLDVAAFTTCLSSGKYDDFIDAQQAGGSAAGVTGTPATFINGTLVSGAVPYATLSSMVEAALAE